MATHNVPQPNDPAHLSKGYGGMNDFGSTPAAPVDPSPLSQSLGRSESQRRGRFEEDFDARTRGSSVLGDGEMDLPQRSASRASTLNQGAAPSRSGTLKKRSSVKRSGSLKRSGSRRSTHAGSIRGVSIEDEGRGGVSGKHNSVFYTPVPTTGSPTEILAIRFQAWRKLLKDLITYFREVATSYEHRAKSLLKVSNVVNNTNAPSLFMLEGGLNDANRILRDFHKQSVSEANKAKEIEAEVINQLSGLRADLSQKIKEIKSLSGDFKNSVEKEKETTRKCVTALEEALASVDSDPSSIAGKGDPYVVRLGVDRQVERQIDEENYLHRAYLNLENSGRELESIVVGEIQKAYNALASILKREADEIYVSIDKLRNGPIGMPRDFEWNNFVTNDSHFVNPNIPLRRLEDIEYPGKHHPATTEVRAGMLERKSKYLKSYTPGWYVLSPTHLHEFKSADRIYTQPPVMSLYLPDQKLGSHSQPGSSSHKFVLKGRQTGSMHRGHTWVFRAETYDTMLAWYEDVKVLTEKTGEERNAFVRRHARSVSQGSVRSARSAASSDGGLEEDEADEVPYSANQSMLYAAGTEETPQRPSPGGRFPSDIKSDRGLQAPLSPSSASSEVGNDLTTASGYPVMSHQTTTETGPSDIDHEPTTTQNDRAYGYNTDNPYQPAQYSAQAQAAQSANAAPSGYQQAGYQQPQSQPQGPTSFQPVQNQQSSAPAPIFGGNSAVTRHDSTYGDWMAPAAGGAAAGALGAAAYNHHQQQKQQNRVIPQTPEQEIEQPLAEQGLAEQGRAPGITNEQTAILAPTSDFAAGLMHAEPDIDSLATTPATGDVDKTFLGGAEAAPAAASGTTFANGGAMPGMKRNNTDFSVSDLHVPGEYPKVTPRLV